MEILRRHSRHQSSAAPQRLRASFHSTPRQVCRRVEFSASPDHHDISIYFKDKTGLNFSIEAGFTLKTEYSDWKSGEQRIIRSWPLFRSQSQ